MYPTHFIIHQEISKIISTLYGLNEVVFKIEHPANESFGDYACNVALVLSKQLKQSPVQIANDIVYKLNDTSLKCSSIPMVSEINVVAPGFINIHISNLWLNNLLIEIVNQKEFYGSSEKRTEERIALEHSNVNPNKAAHVGHLRNACIGQFLEKVYEFLGYNVEVQYYANNVGVQVATSSMGLTKIKNIVATDYTKFDHYAWDVYAAMESLINQSEELQSERQGLLKKLEDPTSPEFISQKTLADKILLEQLKTFSNLNIDYDVVIYESDILNLKMWEKAFDFLTRNPNVYKAEEGPSKGCWLVKMDEGFSEKPQESSNDSNDTDAADSVEKDKIIVRSNGIPTYTGKDIAYHMWKFGLLDIDFNYKLWESGTQDKPLWITTSDASVKNTVSFAKVKKVFDVIGAEQTYAMEVVKKSLHYLGYDKEADNMHHINYGFVYISRATAEKLGMDVSDGKKFYEMSGRKGWGVKIDDFIALVDSQLKEKFGDFEYLHDVRNGAIKVQMLKTNTFQDLVFDLDEALDTKGYSGPYMQYAYVRTRSVGLKAEGILEDLTALSVDSYTPGEIETSLLRWLCRFPEIVKKSADEFAPNMLSDFIFETAKRYNNFYNSVNILKTTDPAAKKYRLLLNSAVGIVIKNGLNLLGINSPEKM